MSSITFRSEPTPDGRGSVGVMIYEGREFRAGGEWISDDYAVAYPSRGGVLTTWDGRAIGTWRATSTWRLPLTCWSASTMSQIVAVIPDEQGRPRTYTGRGSGVGMVWHGRRVARERSRRLTK